MNNYQQYIALSRYSRWIESDNRRETWEETVERYCKFFENKFPKEVPYREIYKAIVNLEVMPSMRCLMTAGPALDRDNVAGFNCSYLAIDNIKAFDELMYVLMCGTGVGFSVERQYVNSLPVVAEEFHKTDSIIVVADSKIGWATAFRELVSLLYAGKIPSWNLDKVRPAGAKLKTFGGRASGPEPLNDLFKFTVSLFKRASGRKLNSLECHDLCCKIAEIVVVGGVRRSALISLSNLTDDRMRSAKNGAWWEDNVQRALANNSVSYTEKPDIGIFLKEWLSLYESKSGERGIFSRVAADKISAKNGRRQPYDYGFGSNPCSEIILRSKQFCNLSEVVIRPEDNLNTLLEKVRLASILGTLQATLTNFRYLSKEWKRNTEEEALLGVSLTGIMDHPVLNNPSEESKQWLFAMREVAIETNKEFAKKLGINQAAAVTCVKPSGTVSQLVDSASGIHPRYSPYYIRTVRADKKDPLAQMMVEVGFPVEDDVTKPTSTYVFSFPQKAPEGSVFRDDRNAIQQLELWKFYQEYWCEHKPSVTIYVKENEWLEVGSWVYKNFDYMSGVSFLPHSDHSYKQAPYQEISEQEYLAFLDKMPKEFSWSLLSEYELEDSTTSSKELACVAGVCEIA